MPAECCLVDIPVRPHLCKAEDSLRRVCLWRQAPERSPCPSATAACPCLQTLVGSTERRGISGGERKRLTTAEILVRQLRSLQHTCLCSTLCSGTEAFL